MADDNPILGVGAGHFAVKYGVEYRPEGYGRTEIPWHTAHSSYFLLLGEMGVPGLVFLIGIIVSNLRANHRVLRELERYSVEQAKTFRNLVRALNASLVGFAVGGAFLSAAYYPHIYVLVALSECGRDVCKKALGSTAVEDRAQAAPSRAYRQVPV